jgi:hypothetical protein
MSSKTYILKAVAILIMILGKLRCGLDPVVPFDATHLTPIQLAVPYAHFLKNGSMVKGGECLVGAVVLVCAYRQQVPPTPLMLDLAKTWALKEYHTLSINSQQAILLALNVFHVHLRAHQMALATLYEQLQEGNPAILLIEGDGGLDAVVLVGMDAAFAYVHFPAWSWTGSGEDVPLPLTQLQILQQAAGAWCLLL